MSKATKANLVRENLQLVKRLYPSLEQRDLRGLRDLTETLRLSVLQGEIICVDGRWYVTHAGLLRVALRHRCFGIRTVLQERQSDPLVARWIFKATVYKSPGSKGFEPGDL